MADLIVLIVAGLFALRGWRRGALLQGFELGGGFVGLLAGVALGPRVASIFTDRAGFQGAIVSLIVVFVCLSLGQVIGYVVGHRFGAMARRARLGRVDAVMGAALGVVITMLAYWLLGSLLANGPSRLVAKELNRSRLLRGMNAVSKPPDLLAYLEQYVNTSGFPQVFAGLPRPIGPRVDLPSGKLAQQAVAAARASTVRIVAPGCGGIQLGSGWIAGADTVVTNAHVVAGSDDIEVEEPGEDAGESGTVVLFEEGIDLAVLKVAGLGAPALSLNENTLEVGAPGATLGYPGYAGGSLHTGRAAVQGSYEARGKDIYGRDDVAREVYELRAHVRQGDSGGPFVQPSGAVAGVVFAASVTDTDTGYALTGTEVAEEIRQGSQSSEEVSTGPCTH